MFEIKFVDEWKQGEIVKLYKAGGWWKDSYDSSSVNDLISGSFAFLVVVKSSNGKAVGMGRIISDGVSDAYFQDIIVLPDYRGIGLGSMIVKKLIDFCIGKGIYWIGLISEPGQNGFYLKNDFEVMKDYVPMKYRLEV